MEITNKRHLAFAQEYISNGYNSTKAYMKVYGVNSSSAEVSGHRLLSNDKIRLYIDKHNAKTTKKFDISREWIAEELLKTIQDCNNDGDKRNKISAINSLTKLFGLDAPSKNETNIQIANIKLSDLIGFAEPTNDEEE